MTYAVMINGINEKLAIHKNVVISALFVSFGFNIDSVITLLSIRQHLSKILFCW